MSRKTEIFLLAALFLVISSVCAHARYIGVAEDPAKIGMGGRPIGMGRAFVAVADDENAIFVNPAGLSFVKRPYLTSMYTSLMGDVNYFLVGTTYPFQLFKNGGIGIAYINSGVPGILSTSQGGFSSTDYHSNVLIIGASFMPRPDLSLGSSLKLFNQGFSGAVNYAASGGDMDLGLKWNPEKRFSLGVNLQNILPTYFGGKITWPNLDEQSMPAVAKIGMQVVTEDENMTFAFDSDIQLERSLPSAQHLGAEWKVHPRLALRAGIDQNLSAASGSQASNITFGIGFNIADLKMDYAYHPYYDEASNLTHYISISYKLPEFTRRPATPEMAATTREPAAITNSATPEILILTPEAVSAKTAITAETARMMSSVESSSFTREAAPIIVQPTETYSSYRVISEIFDTRSQAAAHQEILRASGFQTFILPVDGDQWAVQIGNFYVIGNARKAIGSLEEKGFRGRIIEVRHFIRQ